MRTFFRRFILVLLILMVVVVVGVQIVFWTDWPRRIAVAEAQRITGLQIEMHALHIGWLGGVTLDDLTVRLPLDEAEFARIPKVTVRLPFLPWLALTRNVDIRSVQVDSPTLKIVQNAAGRWNVEQLIDLLGTQQSSPSTNATSSGSGSIRLPAIRVERATLNVVDNQNRRATIPDVQITGGPDAQVAWKGSVVSGGRLRADVVLAPAGDFPHEVRFELKDIEALTKDFTRGAVEGLNLAGTWTGRLTAGGVTGSVALSRASLVGYEAIGGVDVAVADGKLTATPRGLLVKTPQAVAPEVQLTGGTLVIDAAGAQANQIACAFAGGQALLDGKVSFVDRSFETSGKFLDVSLPGELKQSGEFAASVRQDWPGNPVVRAALTSAGTGPGLKWNGQVRVDGTGKSFDAMDWTVVLPTFRAEQSATPTPQLPATAPALVVAATTQPSTAPADEEFLFPDQVAVQRSIVLDQLRADLTTRGKLVTLRSLKLADTDTVVGRGEFDGSRNVWWLYSAVRSVALQNGQTAEGSVDAWGDTRAVVLKNAFARVGQLNTWGSGVYTFDQPQPVDLQLHLSHSSDESSSDVEHGLLDGDIAGAVRVTGTLAPLNLIGTGELDGRDVAIATRRAGNLSIAIEAGINGDEAWLRSDKLNLFGGDWIVRGAYPVAGGSFRVVAKTDAVPVKELASLAGVSPADEVTGNLSGNWIVDVPEADVRTFTVDGRFAVDRASYRRRASTQPSDEKDLLSTQADRIEGRTTLRDGVLRVGTRRNPVRLSAASGGTVELRAKLDLADLTRVGITADAMQWPVEFPVLNTTTRTDVKADLEVQLQDRPWATGPVTAGVKAESNGKPLLALSGDFELSQSQASGAPGADGKATIETLRDVEVKNVTGDVLGGPVDGTAKLTLDRPLLSRATMNVRNVRAEELAAVVGGVDDLQGVYNATLTLAPADDPRPIEPLKAKLLVTTDGGAWRDIAVGPVDATIYLNTNRAVLDQSNIYVAGGLVNVWGRVSQPQDVGLATQLNVQWTDLDLDPITRSLRPATVEDAVSGAQKSAKPVVGKVAGSFTIAGDPRQRDRLFGQGSATVIEADLLDDPLVNGIYTLMNIGFVSRDGRTGRGDAAFRLEGDRLELTSAHYYDRGIEIRASASVRDLWSTSESPLSGDAVGSPKPLGEIKLPLFGELGNVLGAVASNAVPVRISGTLQKPKVQPVPFAELGDSMRKLILGDIRRETRPGSGD